jgi:MFS family permease
VSRSPLSVLRRVAVDGRPLRNRDFRRLFIGNGVAFVGFQLTAVAVPVQMFALTRSSFWVGLLGLAALVPLLVFGLYGGAFSDALDRRLLYMGSSCLVWAATLGLLLQALLHAHSRWLLLALTAVQTVGFAVASPTRWAITPRLLPSDQVPAGNTLNFTMSNVGTVIGPLLAGVVIARGGYSWAYGIDAALFTVGFYAALRLPPIPPLGQTVKPGLRSVVAGLAFIAGKPIVLASFAVDIVAMVFAMPRALFPQIAVDRFHDVGAVGWLFAAIAIGSIVAGLGSGWISRVRRQGLALLLAVMAWGVAVALAGLAHSLWLAVLFLALAGAADLVSAVYRQTILQVYAPDEMRGRLQGVFTVVVAGGPRLGDLRAGITASAVGATASWVAGGIACVVVVIVLGAVIPSLRHYRGPDPVAARPDPTVESPPIVLAPDVIDPEI